MPKTCSVPSLDAVILEAKEKYVDEELSDYEVMYVYRDIENCDEHEEVFDGDNTVYEDFEFNLQ